ncbi:MAG: hypothetical protein AABX96_00270, partial [Nanoarchaeota archaeon]
MGILESLGVRPTGSTQQFYDTMRSARSSSNNILFGVSRQYIENHRHSPIGSLPSEPTIYERMVKAEKEWDAHRLKTGSKLLDSGTPPQFAWEENALSFTERMTGTKRRFTEPYISASIFPPEDITGFKTRVKQYLKYGEIEPLTPKPEPWKSKYVKFPLGQEEPEPISAILGRIREPIIPTLNYQLDKKPKNSLLGIDLVSEPKPWRTYYQPSQLELKPFSILPQKEPESHFDKMMREKEEFKKMMDEMRRVKPTYPVIPVIDVSSYKSPSISKPERWDPFSGVSLPLTTKDRTTHYPGTDLWSKTLKDSSYIIG